MSAQVAFERAFVAISYLLGRRGDDLARHLPTRSDATLRLEHALAADERELRARALAGELARIVAALEARRLR